MAPLHPDYCQRYLLAAGHSQAGGQVRLTEDERKVMRASLLTAKD